MAKKNNTIEFKKLPEKHRGVVPKKETLKLLPRPMIQELNAYVFENGKDIKVAAVDPSSPELQAFFLSRFGNKGKSPVKLYQATEGDIAFILKNYARDFKKEIEELANSKEAINGNIVTLVDRIFDFALHEKASDMHIEPLRGNTVVRFRVDGILYQMAVLPRELHQALIARFKILANLKIDEYRHPQDGRIELPNMPDVSFRVSIIPMLNGEKIALRILSDTNKELQVERLGFTKHQEPVLMRNTEKPFGMILAVGPTGSGKTTTLYGLLNLLRKDGINISTLEDPVEYALAGVNQIQVNPRIQFTFASGLRALLRQDPDIIMVGEVRDSETAIMAADAALTGHLVLSTLHTNDAPSTFTRLLEMRVEDFAVASIVNLVIAQRLVRRICPDCTEKQKLSDVVVDKIKQRDDIIKALENMGKSFDDVKKGMFAVGKGCKICIDTGYSGRIGMFELLELNREIHDLVLQHASADRIKAAAEKNGFKEMVYDGLEKVFNGHTTFDEVLRTTKNA